MHSFVWTKNGSRKECSLVMDRFTLCSGSISYKTLSQLFWLKFIWVRSKYLKIAFAFSWKKLKFSWKIITNRLNANSVKVEKLKFLRLVISRIWKSYLDFENLTIAVEYHRKWPWRSTLANIDLLRRSIKFSIVAFHIGDCCTIIFWFRPRVKIKKSVEVERKSIEKQPAMVSMKKFFSVKKKKAETNLHVMYKSTLRRKKILIKKVLNNVVAVVTCRLCPHKKLSPLFEHYRRNEGWLSFFFSLQICWNVLVKPENRYAHGWNWGSTNHFIRQKPYIIANRITRRLRTRMNSDGPVIIGANSSVTPIYHQTFPL
jgi:hypothetical protein